MKIYVASSWRNRYQQDVVLMLRKAHFEVYDFRQPILGDEGFHWSEIDGAWQSWTVEQYRRALENPIAERGFKNDLLGLESSDACVLVLPCGRSAHLEAGWMIGQGKPTLFFAPEPTEPELMYKLGNGVAANMREVLVWALAKDTVRTCPYPGCENPYTSKPPCALCYE